MRLKHLPRDAVRSLRLSIRAFSIRRASITRGAPHTLPGQLVVSLTSYPPRFRTLDLTLRSLLAQDMAPDALVLWIAHQDVCKLPRRVLALQKHGLLIRECDDYRSYKKIVPALTAYPGSFFLLADDDMNYEPTWLRRFVDSYRSPKEILCQRAKRFRTGIPEAEWDAVKDPKPSPDVMPIGCAGVLYPPGSLPDQTLDHSTFMRLCPTGDDIWLFWMFVSSGVVARRIEPAARKSWAGTQKVGLWQTANLNGIATDRYIAALTAAYGLPATLSAP